MTNPFYNSNNFPILISAAKTMCCSFFGFKFILDYIYRLLRIMLCSDSNFEVQAMLNAN